MNDWQDLSDDELQARLMQRGVSQLVSWDLVEGRSEEDIAQEITRLLTG